MTNHHGFGLSHLSERSWPTLDEASECLEALCSDLSARRFCPDEVERRANVRWCWLDYYAETVIPPTPPLRLPPSRVRELAPHVPPGATPIALTYRAGAIVSCVYVFDRERLPL